MQIKNLLSYAVAGKMMASASLVSANEPTTISITAGIEEEGVASSSISADGRFVVFTYHQDDSSELEGQSDIYIYDSLNKTTQIIDLYHAREHVSDLCKILFGSDNNKIIRCRIR